MQNKKVAIILGTAREGRMSEHIAKFVFEYAQKREDIEPIFIDVRDFPQTATFKKGEGNSQTKKWQDISEHMDGFVVVSPEYNHSFPGELKMFLDGAYKEYRGKPFGIIGVSNGPIGGARMVEHLKPVLSAFQGNIINAGAYFANVPTLLDEQNKIKDQDFWEGRLKTIFDEIVYFSR